MDIENVETERDDSQSQDIVVNGWSKNTQDTVTKWQDDLSESSFIYGEKLEEHENKLKLYLNIASIVGAVMALLTTISGLLILFLDTSPPPCDAQNTIPPSNEATILKWVIFSINLLLACGAFCITITQELRKNYNLEENIKTLTKYIGKLDGLWAVFQTELSISPEERQNGSDFIKRQDGNYMNIIQDAPHMSTEENIKAKEAYIKKMKDHYIWEKKLEKELK